MTALSALRAKAATKYPSFELELDGGFTVTLKSLMLLDDAELKQFNDSQKKLVAMDEEDDVEASKAVFVDILSGISSDRAATSEALDREPLGVLALLFEEYAAASGDASKSPVAS